MRSLLALAVLFAAAGLAPASLPSWEDVVCPVCEFEFEAAGGMISYTTAGVESDLCPIVLGAHPLGYRIWTCPSCRYSRQDAGFREPIPAGIARLVRQIEEDPTIVPGVRQDAIASWRKYALAIRIAGWRKAPAREMADLHLEASWITRIECSVVHDRLRDLDRDLDRRVDALQDRQWRLTYRLLREDEYDGDEGRRTLETMAGYWWREIEGKRMSRRNLPLVRYWRAYLLRRLGECDRARSTLEALRDAESTPAPLRTLAKGHLASMDREREFQAGAVEAMRAALAQGAYRGRERSIHVYLVTELSRRIGKPDASALVRVLAEDDDIPDWLVPLSERLLEKLDHPALTERRRETLRDLHLAKAWSRVRSAEEDEQWGGIDDLRRLGDPRARSALLQLLLEGSAGHAVDISEALLRRAGPSGRDLRRACVGATTPSRRQRAIRVLGEGRDFRATPFLEVALRDRDAHVRAEAAEALSRLGDSRALEPLRAAYERDPSSPALLDALVRLGDRREVEEALSRKRIDLVSRMTNTDFWRLEWGSDRVPHEEDEARFRAWWRENRERPPRDWVLDGFHRSGYAVRSLDDPREIPELIRALGDARDAVRFNAAVALRDLTGETIAWDALTGFPWPLDQADAVARWRRWRAEKRER